jgi:hypothetical protein
VLSKCDVQAKGRLRVAGAAVMVSVIVPITLRLAPISALTKRPLGRPGFWEARERPALPAVSFVDEYRSIC